ncbi:complement component receptor 1-like protein [Brachionichthys hirsutus]|uniref:complement component receptor 1-like protein n=1 Tax=Brachionichthys hirsutus TaxID=412623 RepID=UPI0036048F75
MRSFTLNLLILPFVCFAAGQIPKECAAPPNYPHASLDSKYVSKQKFNNREKVYYNCAEEFTPSAGIRAAQCLDGKWTKLTLKCEKKSCGNAGDLPNGQFEYEWSTYIGEKVHAVCNTGYTLKGPGFMVCKKSGWSGGFPSCEVGGATCAAPAVENAVGGGGSTYRVGDDVFFTCNRGFQLHGPQKITCGPGGRWQTPPPRCSPSREETASPDEEAGGCRVPVATGNSNANLADEYITKTSFASGDRVRYVCDVGYVQAGGSRYRTCVAGRWTRQLMRCERRLCGSAGEIVNGHFSYTGVEFGDAATAVCNEGHRLVGQAARNCLSKGWDGRVPVCEAVECGDPPEVANAEIVGRQEPDYTYGSVAVYRCKVGTLRGPKEIWCTKDGTWNLAPPTCEEITCPPPNVPAAFWSGANQRIHPYRDTISIECYPGYTRIGPGFITCGGDGRWTPSLPKCSPTPRQLQQRS